MAQPSLEPRFIVDGATKEIEATVSNKVLMVLLRLSEISNDDGISREDAVKVL